MIVNVYGTTNSKNHSPELLSALSFLTSFRYGRKTLVLQFTSQRPVEELMLGNVRETLRESYQNSDEAGIETLLRKAKTGGLTEEHFSIYTKPVFAGTAATNSFDITPAPKLTDFKTEILEREKDIVTLLEVAKRVYDVIFLLSNGKDEQLVSMLNKYCDKSVVCVAQGNKQEVYGADDKTIFIIDEFDPRSTYNEKKIRKQYNSQNVFSIPYNCNFRDAYLSNNILKFLYENNTQVDPHNKYNDRINAVTEFIISENENLTINSGIRNFDLKEVKHVQFKADKSEIAPEQVEVYEVKYPFKDYEKLVKIKKEAGENSVLSKKEQKAVDRALKAREKARKKELKSMK